jgi:type VI secretion system protein ImpG
VKHDPRAEVLRHYEQELNYLRAAGAEFAQQYPKVAQRLGISETGASDPHTERLLESFAFLTARLQRRIDSDFPEISASLLGILYPHFTSPIPSMTMASFESDPGAGATAETEVRAGTVLFATSESGESCTYRTCHAATIWPLEVIDASLDRHPELLNLPLEARGAASALRIRLRSYSVSFDRMGVKKLRFFINGSAITANRVFELLFCNTVKVVLRSDSQPDRVLGKEVLGEVGFEDGEAILPAPPGSLAGYRLLQEYFAFPEAFRSVDVSGLERLGNDVEAELILLLDVDPPGQIPVTKDTFRLGCTPAINLFEKTTEPIRFDHRSTEYALVGDYRNDATTEIHSVLEVLGIAPGETDPRPFAPYYAFRYSPRGDEPHGFWHARRDVASRKGLSGTDVWISFLDRDYSPVRPADLTVYARALCTNRDVGERVPAGTRLELDESLAAIYQVSCLTKPTLELDPPLGGKTLWMLVSHLALNHMSLSSGPESVQALRTLLKLYQMSNGARSEAEINGIKEMSTRQVMRRMTTDAGRGFVRGTEITITFDERLYAGSTPFALAMVLNRYFAMYASVNSFTQLVIRSAQRQGDWYTWDPMSGQKRVL